MPRQTYLCAPLLCVALVAGATLVACGGDEETTGPAGGSAATGGSAGSGGEAASGGTGGEMVGGQGGLGGQGGQGGAEPLGDIYVDSAAGVDSNPGTLDEPVKTIAQALEMWTIDRDVILMAGTFSAASGEGWGYELPSGVVVRANSEGVELLGTADNTAFWTTGDAAIEHIAMRGFDVGLTIDAGSLTIRGVEFDSNTTSLVVSGDAEVDVVDHSHFTGQGRAAQVSGDAELEFITGSMADASSASGAMLMATDSARLVVDDVEVSDVLATVVSFDDDSSGSVLNSSFQNSGSSFCVIALGDNGATNLHHLQVSAAPATGILIDGPRTTEIVDVHVSGSSTYGLHVDHEAFFVVVMESTFQSNGSSGALVRGGLVHFEDCDFSVNDNSGIHAMDQSEITIRSSTIRHNGDYGVWHHSGLVPDLGLAGSLGGGNTLQGNSMSNYRGAGGITEAVGNTWDPNTQGSDAQGHYSEQTIIGPESGDNFSLDTFLSMIQF